MRGYQIQQVQQIIKAQLLQCAQEQALIEHLLHDSRQVAFAPSCLFFAISTNRRDGHDFIERAYEQGVRNFVVARKIKTDIFPKANFLLVKNTLIALQTLATYHRKQFNLKTIGITGSNGKTMIKEWLFQLLNPDFQMVRSPKSYNSQIGVPLSVWQIQQNHELGIFEAGISELGEIDKVAPIIDAQLGIFTNLGDAHQAGFPDLETKLKEKLKLFAQTKSIIYSKDDNLVAKMMEATFPKQKLIAWSTKDKTADYFFVAKQEEAQKGMYYQCGSDTLFIPKIIGQFPDNIFHCWVASKALGLSSAVIQQRILQLQPLQMRLEVKEGINHCLVINDSYNFDLTAFGMALNFLEQQSTHAKKTLILSDILQKNASELDIYKKIATLIEEKNIQHVIGIGTQIQQLKLEKHYANTADFLNSYPMDSFQQSTILLKGARPFEFEKIADRLAKKVHRTVLEVNLGALQHNLRTYSNYLKPGTKLMAMVKAAAYGSGAVEVAKVLEFSGVNYLAVAYADEGIELRKAGIQLPVMVLNPEKATFQSLIDYDLEPEIPNLIFYHDLINFLSRQSLTSPINIHFKFDTGMHRLGFDANDLVDLIAAFSTTANVHQLIRVQSILSHLAGSESKVHDKFTTKQLNRYDKMYAQMCLYLNYRPIRHILNSGGIIRFSDYQLDMVRLGIGLYGIDSSAAIQEELQVVNSLKATISQIKQLKKWDTVGYGRNGKVDKEMRTATISIGYADGLPRLAGNGNFSVLIHGKKAPIFGTVCMDMCMVDVTNIPEAKQGDVVEIFGQHQPVSELAQAANTIPYEIFTGISERVKRVYFQE